MGKRAISVTLDADNVTWLRAQAGAARARSVSELLDRLVSDARRGGRLSHAKSVRGTIDIDAADPDLRTADAAVHALFRRALTRGRRG
jgi:hypothetical protein